MANKRPKVIIEKKNYPDNFVGYKWHLVKYDSIRGLDEEIDFDAIITSHVFTSPGEAKADFFFCRNLMNKITSVEIPPNI